MKEKKSEITGDLKRGKGFFSLCLPIGRFFGRKWGVCGRCKRLFLCMAALAVLAAGAVGFLGVGMWETVQAWAFQSARGQLELTVIDPADGKPIPCRMHLRKSKGRPWRMEGLPFWHDHFVFPGQVNLKLPLGTYEFEIERGPEYAVRSGYFTIQRDSNDTKQVELPRFVDMASEGWYAGDLLVGRPAKEMDLLMEAEDMFLAVRVASPGQKEASPAQPPASGGASGRRLHRPGLLVQQNGGAYLLVPLEGDFSEIFPQKPLEKALPQEKSPSKSSGGKEGGFGGQTAALSETQLLHLVQAKATSRTANSQEVGVPFQLSKASSQAGQQKQWWMDVVWPYCWDLPLWLALGKVDSVQVLHSHFRRNEWVAEEKEGRPRDKAQFPGRWGHGLWGQYIYFQILECGFRLPPSAGSGTGLWPNPLGYNRVYVHLEGPPSWQAWWENFRQGRVLITNGPLLRPSVQGKPPGYEFTAPEGQKVELELALRFSTRHQVQYLEIIQNGQVAHSVSFQEYQKTGRLPKLRFDRSGWFLVRAMAETPPTYRLAMTGPYYVRIGHNPRISRSAVQFFLTWLQERELIAAQHGLLSDASLQQAYQKARQFWEQLLQDANAE
ncbi:MAG: hypothetical protein NZ602_17260 [Thermoguttaceae bacterium]|nr:hypothetical protein [Thermoguttaceae bacterium]MDW8037654.1 hypothetical protein [Thermoguttaceae bacterium]